MDYAQDRAGVELDYVTKLLVERAWPPGYGQKHFSYSIDIQNCPFGEWCSPIRRASKPTTI
jgi:hypothetical protein